MALRPPEPLTAQHDLSHFSSGKPGLDNWLRQRALSNQQRGFSSVVVICDGTRVIGYYALAPTALTPTLFPRSVRTGQPPTPLPCILLGQMAVDSAWAGRGIPLVAIIPEFDDYLRPAEAHEKFAAVPDVDLVAVEGGKHLWVGEKQTRRVLSEIVERVNPAALPLPTEWNGSPS